MKRSVLAAAVLAISGSSYAAPFYLDVGTNYDGISAPAGDKVCDTCTSVKDELLFTYQSSTTIIDANDDDVIGAGDTIITDGGLAVGGIANNLVTGFTPNQTAFGESNNGLNNLGAGYSISFSITGLAGVVTGVSGSGVPLFTYGPGLIEMFVTFDGGPLVNFMDIAVAGGGATGVSTILEGTVDFTNTDGLYNDLFHSAHTSCNGDDSFFAIWTNCGEGAGEALAIDFFASFDTNIFVSDFTPDDPNSPNVFTLTSNHDGSATFAVPEPSTVLLLGGAAMLGGLARRKKKA